MVKKLQQSKEVRQHAKIKYRNETLPTCVSKAITILIIILTKTHKIRFRCPTYVIHSKDSSRRRIKVFSLLIWSLLIALTPQEEKKIG